MTNIIKRLYQKSPFNFWGNIISGTVILGLILFGIWFAFIRPGQQAAEARRIDAQGQYSTGRVDSAQDAVNETSQNNQEERKYDQVTQEGNNDIRAANGASDPVDRAVACAGIRAQCMQRSYSGSERCRTLLESCERGPVGTS